MSSGTLEQLLNIKYPILLGGMAGVTDSLLSAAVSEAGGLGTLAGARLNRMALSQQIKEVREFSDKPFAVNIPLLVDNVEELVQTVIHERVPVVITAAGNPLLFTKRLKEAGSVVIHVIPSPNQAKKAEEAGVDAVIAEGFESGGAASPFEIGTLALVPAVVDSVKIPVIAAGGITDARGYLAVRILGAVGVSMGTAFLASEECRKIGKSYKEHLIKAAVSDTTIAARGVIGTRVLKNRTYATMEQKLAEGVDKRELIAWAFSQDLTGDDALFSCGQGVGLIREIKSVRKILGSIVEGAEHIKKMFADSKF